jgi:hypothetical protein
MYATWVDLAEITLSVAIGGIEISLLLVEGHAFSYSYISSLESLFV